jgi:predicted nuclease of restriction endonuclease-like RecB superfamily
MILEWFDSVNSEELLGWYDLSLLQTLLFTCTNLQFSVKGGASWKNILRKVKRLGLMYNLKEQVTSDKSPDFSDLDSELVCSIDGPVSLFKMTDRYGTSIAKLIPFIISTSWWHLSALIVRKTVSSKKLYEFKASSADFRELKFRNEQDKSINSRPSSSYYDSSLEEKFATKFEHLANRWKIKREPEPLIVGNGVAFK